jgi:hypothetical protein
MTKDVDALVAELTALAARMNDDFTQLRDIVDRHPELARLLPRSEDYPIGQRVIDAIEESRRRAEGER